MFFFSNLALSSARFSCNRFSHEGRRINRTANVCNYSLGTSCIILLYCLSKTNNIDAIVGQPFQPVLKSYYNIVFEGVIRSNTVIASDYKVKEMGSWNFVEVLVVYF